MKYFLDSAIIDEIKYAFDNWVIVGITTNPKHILKSGKPFLSVIKELAKAFEGKDFPISVEINPHILGAEKMVEEAKKLAALSENFVIKVPCTEQGLVAAKQLTEEGVDVNMTLVFSTSQAIQVGRIGAKYVSPFIGWQEASGVDCTDFLYQLTTIYQTYGFKTEIIAAAIRNGKQIAEAAELGVDIVTAGFDVYKASFDHPFTDRGLEIFQDAWDKIKKE
ncbi:MAG: transaldolase [Candidatus Heimdallarchaeota archaeon]|nr:transaldolase [Candidatus Heimdallarchaeota archaeon]